MSDPRSPTGPAEAIDVGGEARLLVVPRRKRSHFSGVLHHLPALFPLLCPVLGYPLSLFVSREVRAASCAASTNRDKGVTSRSTRLHSKWRRLSDQSPREGLSLWRSVRSPLPFDCAKPDVSYRKKLKSCTRQSKPKPLPPSSCPSYIQLQNIPTPCSKPIQ